MSVTTGSRPGHAGGRQVPSFVPHPLVRNGHLQTIVGRFVLASRPGLTSTDHLVEVSDGDRLLVHESVPPNWAAGDPVAILVHGLSGSAQSPYVIRLALRLRKKGVRVVRMNLRGAGAGFGLARGIYHAGRSDDVRRVAEWAADRTGNSRLALVGFSLGGNLVLKLAAEANQEPVAGLDCVVAANPPIDLAACCRAIQRRSNRIYDRNFVRQLRSDIERLHRRFPELGPVSFPKSMTVYGFDELYTAPRNGFAGADDYYARSSAGPLIPSIGHPGLVVHSEDDPFVPAEPFKSLRFPERLALELIPGGGHLGYVSHNRFEGDRRWLDSRLSAWLSDRWSLNSSA